MSQKWDPVTFAGPLNKPQSKTHYMKLINHLLLTSLLVGSMAVFRPTEAGDAQTVASASPGALISLVRAYNAAEDGRWNEAWDECQVVANCSNADLKKLCSPSVETAVSSPHQTLAVAYCLFRLGQSDKAVGLCDKLIAAGPASTLPYDLKALVLIQSNRATDAVAVLASATATAPGSIHHRLLQVYAVMRQERWAEARQMLDRDWPGIHSCFLAWNMRGFISVVQGQPGDGLKDFDQALKLNPRFEPARQNHLFASLARSKKAIGQGDTNLIVQDAKGLLGASGHFDLGMSYDPSHGLNMNLQATGQLDTSKWLRGGIYASSASTLEDVHDGKSASLTEALNGNGGASAPPQATASTNAPVLSCPLLIWN